MMKRPQQTHSGKAGFTLIEVLVAITILTFAITATFTAAQSGLASAVESRDQIASFFLAQEAVEYIRNVRDSNSLAETHWLAGIAESSSDPCYPTKKCTLDVTETGGNQLKVCPTSGSGCAFLYQNRNAGDAYGIFGQKTGSGWVVTNFKRELQFEIINANEVALTVTITRKKGGFEQKFIVRESILNWQS